MLLRKMMRDFKSSLGANIACIFLLAIGIMIYNAYSMVSEVLPKAAEDYYKAYNFADTFATVSGMPSGEVSSLESIDGIEKAQGRLSADLMVYMPDWGENIYLRFNSFDPSDKEALNSIRQQQGTQPSSDMDVLLGQKFYDAYALKPGAKINIAVNGTIRTLNVAGSAISPEFVYATKDSSNIYADPKKFDVAFMRQDYMEAMLDKKGVVNSIAFKLKNGYTFDDVKQQLKDKLSRYGLVMLVSREDQISNKLLSEEIKGINMMSKTVPMMFIIIALAILALMLKRMVEQQRGQIGMLKSFGYTSWEVLRAYMFYGGAIGLIGSLIGGALGIVMSGYMIETYKIYFSLPNMSSDVSLKYFLIGIPMAITVAVLASVWGARGVIKLQPFQAMLPPVPKGSHHLFIENIKFLWHNMSIQLRMAVRNIFRSIGRSSFTILGTMLAFAMLVFIFSYNMFIDVMMIDQYTKVQLYDVKLNLASPSDANSVMSQIFKDPDVLIAEPMLDTPVRLINGYRKYDTMITGVQQDAKLYHIYNNITDSNVEPRGGIILSEFVANKLGVKAGDTIKVESSNLLYDKDIRVSEVTKQYFAMGCFMDRNDLRKLLEAGDAATSIVVKLSTDNTADFENRYILSKSIASIDNKKSTLETFTKLLEPMWIIIYFLAMIGVLTAFAVVYNSSVISFSERQRELSSLKVMGMTNKEVATIISYEQLILTLAACFFGLPLGSLMMKGMNAQIATELYSLPDKLQPSAYLYSTLCIILAVLLSAFAMYRKIKNLDLVAVLKERD